MTVYFRFGALPPGRALKAESTRGREVGWGRGGGGEGERAVFIDFLCLYTRRERRVDIFIVM